MYRLGKYWNKSGVAAKIFYFEEVSSNLSTILKIDFVIPPIQGAHNFMIPPIKGTQYFVIPPTDFAVPPLP